MKPIPVLGIPHYNRADLTARCINSIDYPVDKLVVVLQGPENESLDSMFLKDVVVFQDCIKELVVIRHPNAGVAGAWNEIIKLFPAPWWLISNNDIQFAPGDLPKLAEFLEIESVNDGLHPTAHMVYGNHGASWFAITAHGIATAGLFDENIFPAYLEDCDMSRRFDLLGLRRCDVPDVHAIHGDAERNIKGSTTVHSDPELRKKNHRTHGGNFDYYRLKWGGVNEQEKFKTPFNDPNWPLWAWRFDPAFRAEQQW